MNLSAPAPWQIADLERSITATRRVVPEIPELDVEIATLKTKLLEAQKESEHLSLALEDPDNGDRWKKLEGPIPDKEELAAKITQLQERLNDKKEQLLERQLVLEEVTGLSDRLRAQAVDGRSKSLTLAKEINDYQAKIRGVTRRMMATVSELSMYQASCLKLEADQTQLGTLLAEGRKRVEQGLPPTGEALALGERMAPACVRATASLDWLPPTARRGGGEGVVPHGAAGGDDDEDAHREEGIRAPAGRRGECLNPSLDGRPTMGR